MAIDEYLANGGLLADSNVKFAAWPMRCQIPGAGPHSFKWPEWTLAMVCHRS